MSAEMILDASVSFGFVMVFLTVGFAFWRLVLGPSLPDRVVALDMMTVAIVAFCGLAAVTAFFKSSRTLYVSKETEFTDRSSTST